MKARQIVNGQPLALEWRQEGTAVEYRSAIGQDAAASEWKHADLRQVEPGIYSVLCGNHVWDLRLEHTHYGTVVQVGAQRILVEQLRHGQSAAGGPSGPSRVTAAMPGRVVRLLVEEGETVQVGQNLLVLEAMKMQNPINAPRDGVVRTLSVGEGATVTAGALLCVVD